MEDEVREDYPKKLDGKDVLLGLAKAGTSAIPIAGGPLTEILNQVLTPSLQKRRDAWFEMLGDDLADLQHRVGDIEEALKGREDFTTIVIYASQIALRTHQEEKINALRNVIKNTALALNPAEDLSLTYLGILDTLTPSHLQIFQIIGERKIGYEIRERAILDQLQGAVKDDKFAQLASGLQLPRNYSVDFVKQMIIDLTNKGLIEDIDDPKNITDLTVAAPGKPPHHRVIRQSKFGKDFFMFTATQP